MNRLLYFLARKLLSRNFWMLFVSVFTTMIMMAWRSGLRDEIFKEAGRAVSKRYKDSA